MTYPPQDPYGQQHNPYGPQPGNPQYQDWNQPQGDWNQQQYPPPGVSQPGWPGGEFEQVPAKKSKTGLIVGLSVGGVLVVGGAVTAILLLTGGDDKRDSAAPPPLPASSSAPVEPAPSSKKAPSSAPKSSGSAGPARGADTSEAAGKLVVDSLNAKDARMYADVACDVQKEADIKELQDTWDKAGKIKASLAKPVEESGDSATVTVRVEGGGGQQKDTPFRLSKKNGKWCIPG